MPKVLLGDVARERKETCKGSKAGYPIVGLEHLVPEEITLTAWSEDSENTFSKMFHKGDILFGRRRAYLKKAAVAPFDGICSGDITVIEAIADRIEPELLPFIIQNDALFDFAVGKSAGSLSPRVKWEHLRNYEFELPEMAKQRELAELLWAMDATKKSYQELIAATDELVKSQFIEMFGDPEYQTENLTRLGEHVDIVNGFAFKGEKFGLTGLPVIKIGNVNRADFSSGSMQFYDYEDGLTRFEIIPGDVVISLTGTVGKDDFGNACIVTDDYDRYYLNQRNAKLVLHDELVAEYLIYLLKNDFIRRHLIQSGTGVRQCHLHNKDLERIAFRLPSKALQQTFATLIHHADKSKFELEQALSELTATYKSIISENLG